ncbi:aromatic acid/H+ symport family MFS transporter [Oceanobacillus arenosus]|uniref:Aromatic acid/H+ symport family MFS transporter n=1 Tax=Oceanobacillus arenosus TaxID=1229153 RepID=A0A3D8PRW1_9BACI|nr:aromatic acid/H+ symport family MFS transporter [Oceanobacillus arenosus]RDW18452.1 aromatic acid/H+ symport family MFS transporter [Oceanobacillus arenosus]
MKVTNAEELVEKTKLTKFHWILLFWGGILMLFDGFDLTIYGAVVPTLMDEWGISAVQAGRYGSYALFGMMFGALIFGTLADKLGRKKIILICVTIFSVFMLLAGLSPTPEVFGLFRFITGLGLGGMMPNVIGLISEYSPKGMRSRMIATIMAGYSIGGVIAAFLSMILITNYGWKSVFFFGAIPLLFLPFLIKLLPDSVGSLIDKNDHKGIQKILVKANPTYTPTENETFVLNKPKETSSPVKNLFTDKRGFLTVMIWLTYFMSLLMIYGLNTWLPKFMTEAGFPLGSSISFLLALNVGATIGAILMGWIADRWGVGKALILFFLVATVSITSLGYATNMILLYVMVAIAGAATVGTQNLTHSYTSQFYPITIRSTALGWALAVGRIGGILGPTIGGILLASNLTLQLNFFIFAIPGIVAAFAVFLANQQGRKVMSTDQKLKKIAT